MSKIQILFIIMSVCCGIAFGIYLAFSIQFTFDFLGATHVSLGDIFKLWFLSILLSGLFFGFLGFTLTSYLKK